MKVSGGDELVDGLIIHNGSGIESKLSIQFRGCDIPHTAHERQVVYHLDVKINCKTKIIMIEVEITAVAEPFPFHGRYIERPKNIMTQIRSIDP